MLRFVPPLEADEDEEVPPGRCRAAEVDLLLLPGDVIPACVAAGGGREGIESGRDAVVSEGEPRLALARSTALLFEEEGRATEDKGKAGRCAAPPTIGRGKLGEGPPLAPLLIAPVPVRSLNR